MIRRIFESLKEMGIDDSISVDEAKKVRLVNMVCLIWGVFVLIFMVMDVFVHEVAMLGSVVTHTMALTGITASLWANRNGKFDAARMILVFNTLIQTVLFSYYVQSPGNMIELNLCLIPPVSMLFLKDRRWHIILLITCVALYIIPNIYLDPNGPALHFPTTKMTLFIGFYLVVDYFIRLNKKNESNLANQKAQIEELYKFKNRFFVNVAHEIRTPLTILSGNLSRLSPAELESPEAATMRRQMKKIRNIVDDVLDLSKMDTGHFKLKKELIPLKYFIEKTHSSFQSNFQNKQVDYQLINYVEDEVGLWADRVFLERALNNIIHNAFKYISSKTGIVHVIVDYSDGGGITIKVKDNGIGIPAEDHERVFEQFYQVSNDINASGGSGIGLAFSKEVITKLNGEIRLISEPEKGSEFIIRFDASSLAPIRSEDFEWYGKPMEYIDRRDEPENAIPKGETVMLVEDHAEMREYIMTVLKGYQVIEANNGEEALKLLKNKHIDLIITDYMMPVMDGLMFVQTLKDQGVRCPIIVLTARSDSAAKLDMLQLGVDDYLTKPFSEEELLIRISNRLQNAKERNEHLNEEPAIEINSTGDEKLISEIGHYIEEHCGDNQLSVETICQKFNLSSSSLFRKVKGVTGLSPKNLITEIRLIRARDLLKENPGISRKELVMNVGWTNTTYLSKMFEQRFGIRI